MEKYCSKEISNRLHELGFHWSCDYVYCDETFVNDDVIETFGKLSGSEYLKLTKEYGGELKYDDVFYTENVLLPYEKRTEGYVYAVSLMNAFEWMCCMGVRFSIAPTISRYTTKFEAKLWYENTTENVCARGSSIKELFTDMIEQGITLLETYHKE